LTGQLRAVRFRGPAGALEGLWKEAAGAPRGGAVFAHPHPQFGGTMHNKVVYRAAQSLAKAGFVTLRFNFRGVGLSEGSYDSLRGEVDDFRAALDEAERHAGLPLVAGGFSFGAAAALRAIAGDRRVEAAIALGLPLATESGAATPRPSVPTLYAVGANDTYGPPDLLARFVGGAGEIVVVPGTDHFFEGALDALGDALDGFLARLPARGAARGAGVPA
jgi:uncharacterized protein